MTIFILSSSSAGMPSVPGGCLIFSACAAAYQSSLRVGAPASPFPIRLAVGWHLVICALVPTPQCSQKGVSHPCPSICIAWPGLRVVVSVFYCIRSLVQMFLNLILHHKCRHQQVPKYDCTVYNVFMCVLVSIWLIHFF